MLDYKNSEKGNQLIAKELMVNYYGITHEMSATEDDLLTEYHWLCRLGNSHLLFECEKMSNDWKEGSED